MQKNSLKNILFFIGLFLFTIQSVYALDGISFSVQVLTPKVKIGGELKLNLVVYNDSKNTVWWNKDGALWVYELRSNVELKPEVSQVEIAPKKLKRDDFLLLEIGDEYVKTISIPIKQNMLIDGYNTKVPMFMVTSNLAQADSIGMEMKHIFPNEGEYTIRLIYENKYDFPGSKIKTFTDEIKSNKAYFKIVK
ncbi:MAG: hypothetical protein DWQ06_12200 [Calditrichaeota bacterium]|nr:MAG: hypothetical protein DWQ06_12200 [Calditrichota bacterium]